jgi:deoxyribodipyrimidine photo-lyase
MANEVNIFWFRRDLRLTDNVGLSKALKGKHPVVPVFIFDKDILKELPENDARLNFIYDTLKTVDVQLKKTGSSLKTYHGKPKKVWETICQDFDVQNVITNHDYEPYAIQRDKIVKEYLEKKKIGFYTYKDQVIFEKDEVTKNDGLPYTVYTPFKNKWRTLLEAEMLQEAKIDRKGFHKCAFDFPKLEDLGFKDSVIKVKPFTLDQLDDYASTRDLPSMDGTSYLSPHLRFGTIGIRELINKVGMQHETFINELIWREFFMQILYHFPKVVNNNFRAKYDGIQWRNDKEDFEKWCEGNTGYPMVDAGMRQLNETGYMHNRVRMITAGFLCKHLLIDWKWGEAYFAKKLLDYDLSANNGNWQWAAGTGCDAAPYFRIFNPITQLDKFDKQRKYVSQWISELGSDDYAQPMVEHKLARERALVTYKEGIQ